jgi:hypothetical protein
MVRRNFHVAFLALTLNPRRDDHDNPADERDAQAAMKRGAMWSMPDLSLFIGPEGGD